MYAMSNVNDGGANSLSYGSMQRPGREFVDADVVRPFSRHHDESLAGLQVRKIFAVLGFELMIERQSLGTSAVLMVMTDSSSPFRFT